jgi:hypothetical protein
MTTQAEITQRNHRRAVQFFWTFLIVATIVSLLGNIAHAMLPFMPRVVVQVGAAAVPPVVLLAAVHGIALAVRAGASGSVYRWAVGAVAMIGVGAFSVSFLALRDLMQTIGYSSATAWIFPAIIDTAVAVNTMMLVALGDKPLRRVRVINSSADTQTSGNERTAKVLIQSPKPHVRAATRAQRVPVARHNTSAPAQPEPVPMVWNSAQTQAAHVDAELASELISSGVTTQPVETVIAVLAARRDGASINAAAKASGINFRTAQRIVEAARRQGRLESAS